MRTRHRCENRYKNDKGCPRRHCIGKQRESNVPPRKTFSHDSWNRRPLPTETPCPSLRRQADAGAFRQSSRAHRLVRGLADVVESLRERYTIYLLYRKICKNLNAPLKHVERLTERDHDVLFAAGLGGRIKSKPQCALMGCPGQIGHTSWAALSQTVKHKNSVVARRLEKNSVPAFGSQVFRWKIRGAATA